MEYMFLTFAVVQRRKKEEKERETLSHWFLKQMYFLLILPRASHWLWFHWNPPGSMCLLTWDCPFSCTLLVVEGRNIREAEGTTKSYLKHLLWWGQCCFMLLSLACNLIKPKVNETGTCIPLLGWITNTGKIILPNLTE